MFSCLYTLIFVIQIAYTDYNEERKTVCSCLSKEKQY